MKQTPLIILLLTAIVLLGVGSYQNFAQRSASSTSAMVMRAGVLAPLTGDFATFGTSIQNGLELAREELVDSGAITEITVSYEDVCVPRDAVAAVHKLIEVDKVSVISASFCLVGFEPVIPIVEDNKVLAFNTAVNTQGVLNNEYVFSTNTSIESLAKRMAEHAYHELGARTAATVFYATPLGDDYNTFIRQYFEELGGSIIASERGDLHKVDFRSELTKIKAQDPDTIFVIYLANSLGSFLKQTRELGFTQPIISHHEAEDPNVLESAGNAAEGLITVSFDETPTSASERFYRTYEEKFGVAPDAFAANAYDALHLQAGAHVQCKGDTSCMSAALRGVHEHEGASGIITINDDGSASKPLIIKTVQNGEFVMLGE